MGLTWGGTPTHPELVVATGSMLLKWKMLGSAWSPERHRLYPRRFKEVTVGRAFRLFNLFTQFISAGFHLFNLSHHFIAGFPFMSRKEAMAVPVMI
eukprot:scaffold83758_cov20-Prasinocladus_malaysianus.AAC.1